LSRDVTAGFAPAETALPGVGQSHGGVEMRARDGPKSENESHQRGARSHRVGEQGNGHVSPRELLTHDAGTDHRGKQKGRAHRLSDNTA
jgi:hypothetical protein